MIKGELRELDASDTGGKEALVKAVVMVSVEDARVLGGSSLFQDVEIRTPAHPERLATDEALKRYRDHMLGMGFECTLETAASDIAGAETINELKERYALLDRYKAVLEVIARMEFTEDPEDSVDTVNGLIGLARKVLASGKGDEN